MKRTQKRLWSMALCAALVLTLLPGVTLKAKAAGTIYTDQNGQTQTTPVNATAITDATTTLTDGWYILDHNVTLSGSLKISGDIKLILGDGYTLTAPGQMDRAGVSVSTGNALTIYGQSLGTGTLKTSTNGNFGTGGAGIGSDGFGAKCGTITINGGTIVATGQMLSAGIGAGNNTTGGSITINGGTVTATGDYLNHAPDIGGSGSTVILNGGVVNSAHSIGGTVTINGGSINAASFESTPKNSKGDTVYLNTLTVPGQANQAITAGSIGGTPCASTPDAANGIYGICNVLTDSQGKLYYYLPVSAGSEIVSATLGSTSYTVSYQRMSDAAHNTRTLSSDTAVPTTSSISPSGNDIAVSGNIVVAFNEAMDTDSGSVTLSGSGANLTGGGWSADKTTYTIHYTGAGSTTYTMNLTGFRDAAGNALPDDSSHSFITQVQSDMTPPTVTGVLPSGSDIAVSGNLTVTFSEKMDTTAGSISLDGGATSLTGGTWSLENTVYTLPYTELSYYKSYTVTISGFYDTAGNPLSTDSTHNFKTNKASYVDASGSQQFADTVVTPITTPISTLADGWFILDTAVSQGTAINISGDVKLILSDGKKLSVNLKEDSKAAVRVVGSNSLTLYGQTDGTGELNVTNFGVGIGGNDLDSSVGTITINGGVINTKSIGYRSGIGGNSGGIVTINGGSVTSGGYPQGICVRNMTINGGVVTATGDSANGKPDIGPGTSNPDGTITINGGSLRASKLGTTPKNSHGESVYLNTLTVPGQPNQAITAGSIGGTPCASTPDAANGVYGIRNVSTDSNAKLYFYLPASTNSEIVSATVGGTAYRASYQRTGGTANNTRTLVSGDLVVSMAAIGGVTPPVAGGVPVTTIAETDQYTGTVTWSPSVSAFQLGTAYTATITLTPKSGYTLSGVAGNYFTVFGAESVSNNADSDVITAVFPSTEAAPSYGISLNRTGTQTFTGQTLGYGPVTPLSTTVSNTGSQATGNLTVALGGANAGSFTLSKTAISSITTGGSEIFTIVPDGGLSAGTYTATVTVSGSNVTSQTFTVSFTVVNASTPGGVISGGGSGSSTTYQAEVSGNGASSGKLPIKIDMNTHSATADIDTEQTAPLTGGGKLIVSMPSAIDAKSYSVKLPVSSLTATDAKGSLTLKSDEGTVTVPSNMLSTLSGTSGKTAQITVGEGNSAALPDNVKAEIGNRPVIQLTLSLDGTQVAWNNPNAPVTVSIPYTPTAAELNNPDSIVIWYIDGSGKAVCVPSGHYDAATGTVTFTTTHFSLYAVGINSVSFSDVRSSAWYYDAVSFLAAREITTGTGNGTFSPDSALTRGQFLVMLLRAYSIAADENPSVNFADAGDTYYTGYLAAAKRLDISNGVGDSLFAPEKQITRQEMFTLMYNALKTLNQLPKGTSGKALSTFSDNGEIASWAKDAIALLVETGTVSGNSGKLDPTNTTTRAEMAQVLYNLLTR